MWLSAVQCTGLHSKWYCCYFYNLIFIKNSNEKNVHRLNASIYIGSKCAWIAWIVLSIWLNFVSYFMCASVWPSIARKTIKNKALIGFTIVRQLFELKSKSSLQLALEYTRRRSSVFAWIRLSVSSHRINKSIKGIRGPPYTWMLMTSTSKSRA